MSDAGITCNAETPAPDPAPTGPTAMLDADSFDCGWDHGWDRGVARGRREGYAEGCLAGLVCGLLLGLALAITPMLLTSSRGPSRWKRPLH
jgi:hypothetical protein